MNYENLKKIYFMEIQIATKGLRDGCPKMSQYLKAKSNIKNDRVTC